MIFFCLLFSVFVILYCFLLGTLLCKLFCEKDFVTSHWCFLLILSCNWYQKRLPLKWLRNCMEQIWFSGFQTLDHCVTVKKKNQEKCMQFLNRNLSVTWFSETHFRWVCIALWGHLWNPCSLAGNSEFFLCCVTDFVVLGKSRRAKDMLCFCSSYVTYLELQVLWNCGILSSFFPDCQMKKFILPKHCET